MRFFSLSNKVSVGERAHGVTRRTQGTPLRERKMFQEQSANKNTVSFLALHLLDWYFFDLLDILLYKCDNCA